MIQRFPLNRAHPSPFAFNDSTLLVANPLMNLNPNLPLFQASLQQEHYNALLGYQTLQLQRQVQSLQLLKQIQKANILSFVKKDPFYSLPQDQLSPPQLTSSSSLNSVETSSSETFSELKLKDLSKDGLTESNPSQLKSQINSIVEFFLRESGKTNHEMTVKHERVKYANDTQLLAIFDSLNERFSTAGKCREDMIRFVLRKAISSMRNSIKDKQKLTSKAASLVLCQKYFKEKADEMSQKNITFENEDDVLNFLLPYKANSRHRTANNSFVTEIFASEAFYNDYIIYLEQFDEIMQEDNNKKTAKLVDYLVSCAKEGTIHKVKQYKRLPWLDAWLKSTKVIAHELVSINRWKNFNTKKTKTE